MNDSFRVLLNVYSLIILVILSIVFFLKKRMHRTEDNVYGGILISSILTIIIGLLLGLAISSNSLIYKEFIVTILNKGYLYGIFFVISLFAYYTYYVSSKKNEKEIKKIFKLILVFDIINLIIISSLPLEIKEINGVTTTEGLTFGYSFLMFTIIYIIMTIMVLRDFKNIKNKKYIPILLLVFASLVLNVVMTTNPDMNYLLNPIFVINIMIMYFTIENPDIRMIEELHEAKLISDNANEEKTLFLFNMTQEIREVTNKINDDTDIILNSKDYEEIHDSARDIKAITSNFSSATNEILDMSSVDSTTIKIYNNKYNVKNLIKQLVNVYGDICKNKELKFRTNIDHDIPEELYGDGINLKEVLNTILSNSTKYTTKGYIEFSVNAIIKNDICRLIFTIEDSGMGIKSEDINKIKIENKSLSKANKLITLMNGTMLISSDYGVGTKVKVILDQKIGETEETEVSKYESTFDNISILSVDDSESGLKIIEKLLKGTNIKLDLASTGKECIDKIKIGKYDLILLDEELSQISGIELMQKIKEIRNFKTPVILLTKDNSYEYNEEYTKLGFADYILKPIKKEELLTKIDKYTKKDKK